MNPYDVNYLAIVVVAVINVVIGGLWFAPPLFGNSWMGLIGKTKEQVEKDFSPLKILAALVLSLVSAYVLSMVVDWAGAHSAGSGALLGLILGVGLLTTCNGINNYFEHRPMKLFLINNANDLVYLVIAGAILGAWQ